MKSYISVNGRSFVQENKSTRNFFKTHNHRINYQIFKCSIVGACVSDENVSLLISLAHSSKFILFPRVLHIFTTGCQLRIAKIQNCPTRMPHCSVLLSFQSPLGTAHIFWGVLPTFFFSLFLRQTIECSFSFFVRLDLIIYKEILPSIFFFW